MTEQLALLAEEAGLSLVHLAIAFVLRHPAVTSAILGPRTAEHLDSQLGAADVSLSDDILDRIDAIVAPGTNVAGADAGYTPRFPRQGRPSAPPNLMSARAVPGGSARLGRMALRGARPYLSVSLGNVTRLGPREPGSRDVSFGVKRCYVTGAALGTKAL